MKKIFGILLALALVLSLGLVMGTPVAADPGETYYVCDTYGDDGRTAEEAKNPATPWKTIQHAVNTVAADDTINVAAGTYHENVVVNKPLTLLGANAGIPGTGSRGAESIIDADADGDWSDDGIYITSGSVTIDGFKIVDADDPINCWFSADMTNIVIKNNVIDNTDGQPTGGTSGINFISGSGHHSADGAIVKDNLVQPYQDKNAITFDGLTGALTIEGNRITDAKNGIMLSAAPNDWVWAGRVSLTGTQIKDNIVENLRAGADRCIGLFYVDGDVDITGNTLDSGQSTVVGVATGSSFHEIYLEPGSYCTGLNIASNTISNNGYGIYVWPGSEITVPANTFSGNTYDIYHGANIVGTSDYYGDIQDAIDAASPGDTISVAAGTYVEQLTITKSLTLSGAGAASTTIQCPGSLTPDTDGYKSIVTISGTGVNVEFTGFTVQGPLTGITSGITVRDGANANIHDNEVKDIRNVVFGGDTYGILVGCRPGHIASASRATATVKDNILTGWSRSGIAVAGDGSSATVEGNTVTGSGSLHNGQMTPNGINFDLSATGTIKGNTVTNCLCTQPWGEEGDAIILRDGVHDVLVEGNILSGNSGGVCIFGLSPWGVPDGGAATRNITIRGNTITGNHDGITIPGTVYGLTIEDNTITNNDWHGIWNGRPYGWTNPASTGVSIIGNDILNNGYNPTPGKALVGIYIGPDGDAAGTVAHFNNIVGNDQFGVKNDDTTAVFDARYNWWGHETGPGHDTRNTGGQGNAVSDNVLFSPWLYKPQEQFVSGAPCYAGSVVLDNEATEVTSGSYAGGWNSFSTPITLDSSANTISELLALTAGSDLFIERAQRFDLATQAWVPVIMGNTMVSPDYQIKPGEGLFIQVRTKGSLPILVNTNPTSPPMRHLVAGWNLIGMSSLGAETVATALSGVSYSVVLSPKPPNAEAWSVPPSGAGDKYLLLGEAYWVAMGESGILFGFTTTPVADDMTWELNQ